MSEKASKNKASSKKQPQKEAPAAAAVVDDAGDAEEKEEVLANIKAAQLQNGLRHGDYQRYRQYCSRRLRRLRVCLDFTHSKRDFKVKEVDASVVRDVRYLSLPLISAERCWSYAMQLKADMTAETQRKRFHLLKRLTKAASWASKLESLCASCADTRTQLQAEAYASWMNGNILFERNVHDKALVKFLHAKQVYDKLGSIGGSSMQILCEERVATLNDSIRFSQYMLRNKQGAAEADAASLGELSSGGNDLLAAKLEQLRQEKLLAQAQSLDTIQWQNKTIPVSNEKLRLSFVEANNLRQQLDKALESSESSSSSSASAPAASSSASASDKVSKVSDEPSKLSALYQKLFGAYDDALKVLRDSLLEPKMLEQHKAFLLALKEYSTAGRLDVQIIRNRQFVGALEQQLAAQEARPRDFLHKKKNKPDEVVVLYEKLIANLQELSDIALANKNAGQARMLAAQVAAATALRLFYLAESYRRIKKYVESYLLYSRCMELTDEFSKQCAKLSKEEAVAVGRDTARVRDSLKQECAALRGQVHAQALLEEAERVAKLSSSVDKLKLKTAAEEEKAVVAPTAALTLPARLDTWDSGDASQQHALLDFPPTFQSAPAKPILFDLAFNQIEYPDIAAKIKKMAAKSAGAAAVAAPAPAAATKAGAGKAAAVVAAPAAKAAPAAAAKAAPAAAAAAPAPAAKQQQQQQAAAKKQPEPEPEPEEEEEEEEEGEEEEEEEEEEAPKPAPKAAAKAAVKQPAPKPAAAAAPAADEEEDEYPSLSAASSSKPKSAPAPAAAKKHAPPGESKADKARREKAAQEEAEKKAAADAAAAKKKGWGIGGLLGKMIGR